MSTHELPPTFAAKVRTNTECQVWIGATNSVGYGVLQVDKKLRYAHRLAFEAEFGPIDDGLVLDHICRVRNCVNPFHLEAVTVGENNRRGRRAGSLTPGDTCDNGHFISNEDDLYIRSTGTTECRACRASGDHKRASIAKRRRLVSTRTVEATDRALRQVNGEVA